MSQYTKNNAWFDADAAPDRIHFSAVARFARQLWPARGRLAGAAALSLSFSVVAALIPVLFRTIEQAVRSGDTSATALALGGYLAVMAFQQVARHFVNRIQASVYTELSERALLLYYKTILNVRVPTFLHMRRTTSLFQRVIDVMNVTRQFTSVAVQGTLNVITVVVLGVVLFVIGWPILLVLLVGGAAMAAFVLVTTPRLRRLHKAALGTSYPLVSKMLEIINGMLTVKALTATVGVTSDVQALVERRRTAQYHEDVYESRLESALGVLNTVSIVGALGAGFWMLLTSPFSVSDLFAAYVLAGLFLTPVQSLARQYRLLARISEDLLNYFEVIDMETEATGRGDGLAVGAPPAVALPKPRPVLPTGASVKPRVVAAPGPERPAHEPGRVTFEDVAFSYREGVETLKGISVDIRPGERVALIGKSGAGKTTMFRLLLGFLRPTRGRVLVGGQDPTTVPDLTDYRRRIGVVSQSDFLFSIPIRDNLCIGTTDKTDAELEAVLRTVNLWDEVEEFEHGLGQVYSDDKVSGGQRQRLLVARALIRQPDIVLLDEPTSALDFENEREVLRALDLLIEGKTSLIIAHRLSTVRSADRVLVLREGGLVADGTHDELYETDDYYRSLCDFNSFLA